MPLTAHPYVISLPQGPVEVREVGQGRPLLFLHGAFSNSSLWDPVVQRLAPLGYRCLLPTLPLGAHRQPLPPGTDLSPPGVARLIADLIGALNLGPATVISNDTGTAFMQLVLTDHPHAVAAAVLTSGDAYDHFLPPVFASLKALPYVPGGLRLLAWTMRQPALARQPWAFGRLSRCGMTPEQARQWSAGLLGDRGVRRDTRALIRGFHRRHTLNAAARFPAVSHPVQVIWGREDRVFPLHLGQRLARELPGADLQVIDDSGTYLPLDVPDELTRHLHAFLQGRGASPTPHAALA